MHFRHADDYCRLPANTLIHSAQVLGSGHSSEVENVLIDRRERSDSFQGISQQRPNDDDVRVEDHVPRVVLQKSRQMRNAVVDVALVGIPSEPQR